MEFSENSILSIIFTFFISLCFIVACFAATAIVAFRSKGIDFAKIYAEALVNLKILEIMLAIIMVFAATMLAVARVISGDAVVTIISGITGYVLGGLGKDRDKNTIERSEKEAISQKT